MFAKTFWTLAKLLTLAFVAVNCLVCIKRMAMATRITGDYLFLGIMLFVAAFMAYWAYRVIWRPIKR